ncbi:MAG: hypothetical protein ACM3WU_05510 [Bacillota bacterium]
MKKALILGLVAVLILGLPSIAMAGKENGKVKGEPSSSKTAQFGASKHLSAPKHLLKEEKVTGRDNKPVKFAHSQGAVHSEIVIDYNVPGGETASGTATITIARGNHVETFEVAVPWGLTNDEAAAFLMEAFGPLVQEAFGLEARSLKLTSFAFDEETGVATASVIATHGEAPLRGEIFGGEEDPEAPDPEDPEDPGDPEDPVDPDEETDEELDEEVDEEVDNELDEETDEESDDSTTDL